MTFTIQALTVDRLAHFDALFSSDGAAHLCRCMWFIKPVRQYHADGAEGNWEEFQALARQSSIPLGLLAYDRGNPVGWCATGPRSRFVRAIKTPTYKGRDPAEDNVVWMVPCIFVLPSAQGTGLAQRLIGAAVDLATAHGAKAIEAFPYAGSKRRSADIQVGFQANFVANGFRESRRPSDQRIVMRKDF
jgi:GNAT superfamily N-acetyltransferase